MEYKCLQHHRGEIGTSKLCVLHILNDHRANSPHGQRYISFRSLTLRHNTTP